MRTAQYTFDDITRCSYQSSCIAPVCKGPCDRTNAKAEIVVCVATVYKAKLKTPRDVMCVPRFCWPALGEQRARQGSEEELKRGRAGGGDAMARTNKRNKRKYVRKSRSSPRKRKG